METATIEKPMSANILCSCGCKTKNYKKKLMGLKIRIFIKAEHNSMFSAAALLRKAASAASTATGGAKSPAPAAKASAAPPSASSVGGGDQQAVPDKRGARGKGGGKQSLTDAQIAANDAVARLKAEEAELAILEVQAKKAETKARIDKAKSGESSAPVVSTPRAQGGHGGGDFVTHAQFKAGIDSIQGDIRYGFTEVLANQYNTHEKQNLTNAALARFAEMAEKGSGFQLSATPAPVSRQIGNCLKEEPRICFGPNAGWNDTVNGSSGGAATSFRASSAIEGGRTTAGSQRGGQDGWSDLRMPQSSEMVVHREAPSEYRSESGGSVPARQLGVKHLPNFEASFSKMKSNDFNNFIGDAIRRFARNCQDSDFMACVLLAMVNGKKYPNNNPVIIQSNESVFRQFFGELTGKFSGNSVKITNNRGQECSFSFTTLSRDASTMVQFIRILRGDE